MRVSPLFALIGATLLLGCGDMESDEPVARRCTLARPLAADSRLTAEGTRLVDTHGRTVSLRGVNAGGRSKFAPFAPFDFDDGDYDAALAEYLDRAEGWGINVLRVPFTWEAVEPEPGVLDEAFLVRYDKLLDAAWARGMRSVVDFHQDVYAAVYCGDGFPAWTIQGPVPEPHHDCPDWFTGYLTNPDVKAAFDHFWADDTGVQTMFASMWDKMAARHANRPGVIGFEVINEPGWGTADTSVWGPSVLAPFYSRMAERIQAAAPGALVFFDTTGIEAGAGETSLVRPEGEGLVFAPHYYDFKALIGAGGDPDSVAFFLAKWASVGEAWDVPVLLGEFGIDHDREDATAYIAAHFDALDALGMHGTYWEYSDAQEAWNDESLSVMNHGEEVLPVVEGFMRPYPRALAGSDARVSYEHVSRELSLTYAPAAGITEVAVPVRLYPNGASVSLTGACFDDAASPGVLLLQADEGAAEVRLEVRPK